MYSIICSSLTGETVNTILDGQQTKREAQTYMGYLHKASVKQGDKVVVYNRDALVVNYRDGLGSVFFIKKDGAK